MNYPSTDYAASKQPAPTNPLPGALSQLGTAIHEMGVLSDTLANRLGGVMMPVKDSKASGAGLAEVESAHSPTTDEIKSLRRRVENIGAQLQDVLNRLEV